MTRAKDGVRGGRRGFLKRVVAAGVGATAAPWIVPSSAVAAGDAAPSAKLNIAAIGTGGRCSALLEEVLRQGENVVALCDVDAAQIASAQKVLAAKSDRGEAAAKVRVYDDYRKLLEAEKTVDAVLVATGSRWHAPISVPFMKAGKHVYCEKPLVHKLAEARELIELAPKCKVATQTGTQGGSAKAFRRAVEVIHAGLLGPVREVYLWCDGYGPNPPSHRRPDGEDPVPSGLNWDFWLGPAPLRPFKKGVYHPGCLAFQNWFDLCNGMLAGQGAHTFYLPVQALRLGPPSRVVPEIPEPVLETYVSKASFRYEFPARGDLPPVTLWWTDGGKYPPEEVTRGLKTLGPTIPNMGCLFRGERGELFAGGWGGDGLLRLKGEKQWRGVLDHEAAKPVPATLPRIEGNNHMLEWLRACKGGPRTLTGFEVGAKVAEVYLPGIVALRLGRPIEWDAANLRVPGVPEADPLIHKTYRTKWLITS
jgi:hypothetical protein